MKCKKCDRDELHCYAHCHKSNNGYHKPDMSSAQFDDDVITDALVIDIPCKYCDVTGSVEIIKSDINWE